MLHTTSLQVHSFSIPATELEPEELAELYVTYTMLALLQARALRDESDEDIDAMYEPWERVAADFPSSNPTTPEAIQSELDENATLCNLEPKSFDE